MSRERARRRAQREALAAAEQVRRERARARARSRRRVLAVVAGPLASLRRRHRGARDSRLAAARRRQDGALLAILLAGHVALWLATGSWWVRGAALLLTVLAWPVLLTLLFDRRPSR